MSIRIGWSRSRPKSRKPGKVAGGIWLLELLKLGEHGRARHFVIGFLAYNRHDLQRFLDKGHSLDTRVIGLLRFESDVTPVNITSVFHRIEITGKIIASPELSEAIRSRLGIAE